MQICLFVDLCAIVFVCLFVCLCTNVCMCCCVVEFVPFTYLFISQLAVLVSCPSFTHKQIACAFVLLRTYFECLCVRACVAWLLIEQGMCVNTKVCCCLVVLFVYISPMLLFFCIRQVSHEV